MADNDTTARFPYQHLAVLGMGKLKKYVPPATSSTAASTTRISSSRIVQMLADQGNRCAVCPTTEPGWDRGWVIDHCHNSTKIRGLVCVNCNLLLGHAKDNPETLRAAADYLEKHNEKD